MVFCLFGICWVMPQRVVDLLDCWSCNFRCHRNIVIWRMVPHCLLWCNWRERNARSFEGRKRSILEFKSFFFFTLLKWCLVLPSFSCLSLPVLFDHCNLVSWCFCLSSTFPMYGAVFFNIYLPLLIKKKKKYHLVKWKIVVYQFNMGNRVCVIWFCLISHECSYPPPSTLPPLWTITTIPTTSSPCTNQPFFR